MRIKHCKIYICVVSLIDFVVTKQEKQLKKEQNVRFEWM